MDLFQNVRWPLHCITPPPTGPPLSSCQKLRNQMPVSDQMQVFGPKSMHVDVALPLSLHAGKLDVNPFHDDDKSLQPSPFLSSGFLHLSSVVNDVLIPKLDDNRCTLTIYGHGSPDQATWASLYKAATQMEAECVTQGKRAVATGLGEEFFLLSRTSNVNLEIDEELMIEPRNQSQSVCDFDGCVTGSSCRYRYCNFVRGSFSWMFVVSEAAE